MNNVNFRGGGETTGSIAQNATRVSTCPSCNQTSFKADSFEYSGKPKEKKHTGLKLLLGALATAGLVIGGLGCASKYADKLPKWLDFLKKDGFAQATKKCHDWCKWTVGKGRQAWNWVRNIFTKDKA
jgi:hypothetical protein